MEECPFCAHSGKYDLEHILMEDEYAIAFLPNRLFRKGNCLVAPKRHMKSISEMTAEENASVFQMITAISKALEKTFQAEKTYLLSISDQVKHLHYHLIPKLEGQISMGKYCFIKLIEAEGYYEPKQNELNIFAGELRQCL